MTNYKTFAKFSRDLRERAVGMVLEHRGKHAFQWAAMVSIAVKMGSTASTPTNG
jgi:transposase